MSDAESGTAPVPAAPNPHIPDDETVIDCFLHGAEGEFIRVDFTDWLAAHDRQVWDAALTEAAVRKESASRNYVAGDRFKLRGTMEKMGMAHHFMQGWDAAIRSLQEGNK